MSYSLPLRFPVRILVDVILLVALCYLTENFTSFWWPTTQRGFFCDDESLMYPYHKDTVSSTLLHWLGLYGPLVIVLVLELCASYCKGSFSWKNYYPVYNTLRWYLFGYAVHDLLKSIGKHSIGRLRPHFLSICAPVLANGGNCTHSLLTEGRVYHTNYSCQPELTGATEEMLKDVHISFPSGHSIMAFYGLVFLALHLRQQRRCPLRGSLLVPVLQLICLGVAWFVALSRVMDYKHHWSDVAAGSLLGASVAVVVVRAAKLEEAKIMVLGGEAVGIANEKLQGGGGGMKNEQLPHDLSLVTCRSS